MYKLIKLIITICAFCVCGEAFAQSETDETTVLVGTIGQNTSGYEPCKLADPSCDASTLKSVQLPAFYVDKYEVTYGDILACMDSKKCQFGDLYHESIKSMIQRDAALSEQPADVERDIAIQYCKAQSKRLPSPAEWLLAAMGTAKQSYVWGEDHTDGIWAREITKVGEFPRDLSVWGAFDMGGNAPEWVTGECSGEYEPGNKCLDPRTWPSMGNANRTKVYEQFGQHNQAGSYGEYHGFRCVKDVN